MADTEIKGAGAANLRSREWSLTYRTSSAIPDKEPVDMLHDFYIPALRLAAQYDRVAGYFRSSSLAAASQGFSSFVNRRGRMRLIVGADLEPADVKAILDGDRQRLADRLNQELDRPEQWPEGVQNGVHLLAWMVARSLLEVRVAFRVHGVTGEPLSPESVADGYVHEKWFILRDHQGNRLYGAGTLNESKTALTLNAENVDVHCDWWGETEQRRIDDAEQSFENLWKGAVPYMPVMTLPEAVRRRLIHMAEDTNRPREIDGSPTAHVVRPPSTLERLRFAVLKDAPKMPGGRFVGLTTAPVAPWPHQEVVARRLVDTWPYSYLLCDEVGLGKTIEAGLAFRALHLSGLVHRILIAAPAALTRQWQREMAAKMLLSFGRVRSGSQSAHAYIFPKEETHPAGAPYDPDLVIISTGLLARKERLPALADAERFGVALVDEAHAARRRNPTAGVDADPDYGYLYQSIREYLRKQTASLWLATATPMQIHTVEVCDLLALMNRVGAFQWDPALTLESYELLGRFMDGEQLADQEWKYLRRVVESVPKQDPLLWRYIESYIIDGRMRQMVRQWLKYGRIPRRRDRSLLTRLVFSALPLSRVMLRHGRQLLEIYRQKGKLNQNLARRHVLPLPEIRFEPLEKRMYDRLEGYCAGLSRQMSRREDGTRQMTSFLLSFLRLRFASSLYALNQTLRRRLAKVEATLLAQLEEEDEGARVSLLEELVYEGTDEDDLAAVESLLKHRTSADLQWERKKLMVMIREMEDLSGTSSKMRELLRILDGRRDPATKRIKQTVIFTRFYDTLTDIVRRLHYRDRQMRIGTYSGQGGARYDPDLDDMVKVDREEVKVRFLRGEIDVLVCTDAAAEGLNLQTSDLLINFDLGWNPMKVEQRIGRIDRIGQKHTDIYVVNLCYLNSAEELVYGRLLERLAQADLIVGTQQLSLLPVKPEEFRKLAEGEIDLDHLMHEARGRVEAQRQRTRKMEQRPEDLYDTYMRMARAQKAAPAPVTINAIREALSGSHYLRDLGCVTRGEDVFIMKGIDGVPDGTVLTTSREVYEKGLGPTGGRVHFASYGDPYFDTVLDQLNSFDLPPCIRRLEIPVRGMEDVRAVAYAVACRDGGVRTARLIRGCDDLRALSIGNEDALGDQELEPLRRELDEMVRAEFAHYAAAAHIQRDNIRAALAQEILSLAVGGDLLEVRARSVGEGALFWPVHRQVLPLYDNCDQIQIPGLPGDILGPIREHLLFDHVIPKIGNKALVLAPRILGYAAVSMAARFANSMRVGRSELKAETVISRINRRIGVKYRQYCGV